MASNGKLNRRRVNTRIRKVPYRKMLRQIIVVGMPKKYISIVYRGKEINKVLIKGGLSIE